jgi:hypothetical protein
MMVHVAILIIVVTMRVRNAVTTHNVLAAKAAVTTSVWMMITIALDVKAVWVDNASMMIIIVLDVKAVLMVNA